MSRNLVIWLAVCVAMCTVQSNAQDSRTVSTTQGPVRGYKNDDDIFHFYGIPYATAPTGAKRFTAPLPAPVWMHPFEAVDNNIICPQAPLPLPINVKMQENCLIANIHVPVTEETNLPVLVYVHGGAYAVGYGEMASPISLVRSKKLIAVTFNYRLGAHGFLCLGTEYAPGNAGMKDQVALLRWVRNNIANFGGNPDDVTIAGGSAGSSAVELLMLSKMSQGLFSKVISESGSSLSAWSVQMNPLQIAKDFAEKLLNFNNVDDIHALQEYYKSASLEKLTSKETVIKPDNTFYFTPCLERELGEETFLNEAPLNILKEKKYKIMPILSGFANMEGLLIIPYFKDRKDKMNEHFADFLPSDLKFSSEEEKLEIAKKTKQFYFGDQPISEDTVQSFIDYNSDTMFAYSQLRAASFQVEAGSEVYLYEYSFYSPFSAGLGHPELTKNVRGAGHVFQSMAIYESDLTKLYVNDTSAEYEMMRANLRDMWINFITTGKPVPDGSALPQWPPLGANRSPYMDLGQETKLKGPLLEQRARFWDQIYEQHSRTPVPPAAFESRKSRTVSTAQGPVRGYISDDGELYQFYGIPYATAPTGERKYTAPLPGPVWMQPLEAVENNIICPQAPFPFAPASINVKMQDNCLVVNIHTPNTEAKNLPVAVIVHGGGYSMGSGAMFSPASLVRTKKIIAVTFNYRLGAHGFLCLGTEDAPGNAGMKDQVALLRWVKKNIANFGGNPDDVTIIGFSAGSSSVDLLMLSELTEGLFHRVIPESGTSLSVWSVQMDPIENARDFAKRRNVTKIDDIDALEKYYKYASFDELTSDGMYVKPDSTLLFTPCVERDIGQEMFLREAPMNILKQGKYKKVPVLSGFANMEGLFAVTYFDERKDKMNKRFEDYLPADLQFSSEKEKNEVAKNIKEFYFGDQSVSEKTIGGYIDYFTDIMFAYSQLRVMDLQVAAGSDSIYLYEYSFYSPFPQGLYPDHMSEVRGAGHCYQSFAIYDAEVNYLFINDSSEEYKKMRATLREIWVNFITTGTPVPKASALPAWPPVGANRSPYMDLGQEVKLKSRLLEERVRFWDEVYERHYRTPVPPRPKTVRTEL